MSFVIFPMWWWSMDCLLSTALTPLFLRGKIHLGGFFAAQQTQKALPLSSSSLLCTRQGCLSLHFHELCSALGDVCPHLLMPFLRKLLPGHFCQSGSVCRIPASGFCRTQEVLFWAWALWPWGWRRSTHPPLVWSTLIANEEAVFHCCNKYLR